MPAPGRDTIARVVGPLAAATAALLAVALLRGAPALALHGDGAAAWWPFVVGAGVTGCLGAASVTWIAAALRAGSPRLTATAAGLAVLSVGMAIAAAHALDTPARFPDGGLSVAAIAGALAVALGAALPGAQPMAARRPVLVAVAIFVVVETAAAGSILAADRMSASAAWLLAVSGLLIAAATLAGARPSVGFALLAAGFGALALARPGTLDLAPALVALAGGGLLVAWRAPVTRADAAAPAQLTVEPPTLLPPLDGVPAEVTPIAATDDDEARQETQRLTRELRGTIEELMQTRRTVELQRSELARAAATDPLTGTASRRAILERLSFEAAEARRYTHPLAVLLLDVDGLTQINHAHGMAVGDAVLRELALRMRLRIRAADALGRHGADSFLAILPHTDERGAAIFADALRRRLGGRPIMTEAGELRISVSIGVAFVRPGMDVGDEELLAAADEALASARAAGGNRIAFDRLHGLVRLDDGAADAEPG